MPRRLSGNHHQLSRGTYVALLLIILFIILSVSARIWASYESAKIIGPYLLTTDTNENTYFIADNSVFITDRNGNLQDKIPVSKFSINGFISDLLVLQDGSILIGDASRSRVNRCNIEILECDIIIDGRKTRDKLFKGKSPFKMASDEHNNRLYFSDTYNDRISIFSLDGKHIKTFSNGTLDNPGSIVLHNDLLYVADTRHQRIVVYDTSEDNLKAPARYFYTSDDLSRSSRNLPVFTLLLDNGDKWVINANKALDRGDLAILNSNRKIKQTVLFGGRSNPGEMAVVNNNIVIADSGDFRLKQFTKSGDPLDDFGSNTLKIALSNLHSKKTFLENTRTWSLSFSAILLLAGIFLVSMQKKNHAKGRRVKVRIDGISHAYQINDAPALPADIEWIAPDPERIRLMKTILTGICILTILTPSAFYLSAMSGDALKAHEFLMAIMIIGCAIIISAILFNMLSKIKMTRIGYDGQYIYIMDYSGRIEKTKPEYLIHTNQSISTGSITARISNLYNMLYYSNHNLTRLVFPILNDTNHVSRIKMFRHQLSTGDSYLLSAIGLGIVSFTLILFITYMKSIS